VKKSSQTVSDNRKNIVVFFSLFEGVAILEISAISNHNYLSNLVDTQTDKQTDRKNNADKNTTPLLRRNSERRRVISVV